MTEAERQYNKKWRAEHPDKVREYNNAYKKRHPDKVREYNRRYNKAHPEKASEYNKRWRANNAEKIKEYQKKRRSTEEGKAQARAYSRKHYAAHREEHLAKLRAYNIKAGRENARTDFILDVRDTYTILMFEDYEINSQLAEIEVRITFETKWYGKEIV